jgi:oxygen-dependent protoporphyrinogen oxidase
MIGGAHDPKAVAEEEGRLVSQVLSELGQIMGIRAEPSLARVYRWPLGIGQYLVGHGAKLEEIHRRLGGLGPLWLAGSSFYGVSMNACIEKAGEHAGAILARFSR